MSDLLTRIEQNDQTITAREIFEHVVVNLLRQGKPSMRQFREDDPGSYTDPALRLMAHQLAYLMGVYEIDQIEPVSNHPYDRLTAVCVRHVSLDTVRALQLERYLIQEAPHA